MYVLIYGVLSDDLTLSDYTVLQSYPVRYIRRWHHCQFLNHVDTPFATSWLVKRALVQHATIGHIIPKQFHFWKIIPIFLVIQGETVKIREHDPKKPSWEKTR